MDGGGGKREKGGMRGGREGVGYRSFETHQFGECQLGEGSLSRDLNTGSVIVN